VTYESHTERVPEKTAHAYELFSLVFAKESTRDILEAFQSKEVKDAFGSLCIDPVSDIGHLSLAKQEEALAVEFAGLFITPKRPVFLRESLERGEGRLWGNYTVQVNKIYAKFGFALDDRPALV